MKINIQHKGVIQQGSILLFILSILMCISCNKEFVSRLPDSYPNDTLGLGDGSKKVLYIIMDGVRGSVLQELAPANLSEITQRSIFSYDGLADYQRSSLAQASAWTTMLTGVDYTKHGVQSEDFSSYDPLAHPTLFGRLAKEQEHARTIALTSSLSFKEHLAKEATVATVYTDDAAVKTAVLAELDNQNPALLTAHFNGAELVASGDYSKTNVAYTEAILKLDNYIGEMLAALRRRKTFPTENWLVVIASSKGGGTSGTEAGEDIYKDFSRNTFVAFYNPRFKPEEVAKPSLDGMPYTGTAPRFIRQDPNTRGSADLGSNTTIGNFGTSGDYTLMFKFRDNNPTRVTGWPAIFGKQNPATAGTGGGGWEFNSSGGGNFQFYWNGISQQNVLINTKDLLWHTVGFTVSTESGKRLVKLYYDHVSAGTYDITGKNADTNYPMFIGAIRDGSGTNFLFRDLVILNVALPEIVMKAAMRKEFGTASPYFSNAIAWWPGNENSGSRLYDRSGNGNDFMLKPEVQFATFSDLSPNISPDITESAFKVVPNGVDIPVFIYNWLNVGVSKDWELMGKLYRPTFNLPKD